SSRSCLCRMMDAGPDGPASRPTRPAEAGLVGDMREPKTAAPQRYVARRPEAGRDTTGTHSPLCVGASPPRSTTRRRQEWPQSRSMNGGGLEAERRRSRTDLAVGYTTVRVLK